MSSPSRKKGWVGEDRVRKELRDLGLTRIQRTGSLAYTRSAADLVQPGTGIVRIVATQADRKPMLYTLTARDLSLLVQSVRAETLDEVGVFVQVKKLKRTAISTLYDELARATQAPPF